MAWIQLKSIHGIRMNLKKEFYSELIQFCYSTSSFFWKFTTLFVANYWKTEKRIWYLDLPIHILPDISLVIMWFSTDKAAYKIGSSEMNLRKYLLSSCKIPLHKISKMLLHKYKWENRLMDLCTIFRILSWKQQYKKMEPRSRRTVDFTGRAGLEYNVSRGHKFDTQAFHISKQLIAIENSKNWSWKSPCASI